MENESISFEYSQKLTAVQRSLYAYILSLLPNRSDAEDILQETNLILCKKAREYDPEGHFQGWAFSIARFQVMKHIMKFRRSKLYFSSETIDNIADEMESNDDLVSTRKVLQVCYEQLPKHMTEIARLRFKEELNLKEISSRLNRPIGSVSATLHRIRANLRICVKNKIASEIP